MSNLEKCETIRSVDWTGSSHCMRTASTASLLMRWSVLSHSPNCSPRHFKWSDEYLCLTCALCCCCCCCFLGFGEDSADHFPAGLYEALQEHPWSPHGAGAQVHPLQLDEWVQEMGAFTPCRLPDWRQRREGRRSQNTIDVWKAQSSFRLVWF